MTKLKHAAQDSITMFKRCFLLSLRNSDVLLTAVFLPVMMMLMFVYLFGGAISVGDVTYVNYVVPGVIVLTIGYCASVTAVSVNSDMTKGIIDRFRSMPISNASVLTGHVLASVVRNYFATVLVVLVALLIGFRPQGRLLDWLVVAVLVLLYMLVITWIAVLFGLLAKSPDGAGAFGFFILFLPYLSSGFVPTETMPAFLRLFAENQPLTPVIEAMRALLLGWPKEDYLLTAFLWCAGLLVIFYAIAIWQYKRKV